MIGRADIEGSKSDVAMNAWPPQASYPCGTRILRCYSETPARTGGRRPGGQTAHLRLGVPPGPSSETPLSGWADYTIRRLLPPGNGSPEPTHARLVVEPSPGAKPSGAWLRIAHCSIPWIVTIPAVRMRPAGVFPPGLGTKGFRGSPQFGRIAPPRQAVVLRTESHGETRPARHWPVKPTQR